MLHVTHSALRGESDPEARRAACYLLATLLASLGTSALEVLDARQLADAHRALRATRDAARLAGDEALEGHACEALEAMRTLGLALTRGVADVTDAVEKMRVPPSEYAIRMPGGALGGAPPAIEVLSERAEPDENVSELK